jgi:hypothetical protein
MRSLYGIIFSEIVTFRIFGFYIDWAFIFIFTRLSLLTEIYTVKKVSDFPVPARDVTNQISLAGNN